MMSTTRLSFVPKPLHERRTCGNECLLSWLRLSRLFAAVAFRSEHVKVLLVPPLFHTIDSEWTPASFCHAGLFDQNKGKEC